jgi:allantoin racemase
MQVDEYEMRLRVIFIASESSDFIEVQKQQRLNYASPGTEIEITCLTQIPEVLESAYDEVMAAPHVIREVERANEEGADAVIIDCVCDPGLHAAREVSSIPVVGPGEAAFSLALTQGTTFSVIVPSQPLIPIMVRNLRAYGVCERVASVRSADVPILDLGMSSGATERIVSIGRRILEEENPETLVLGCTGMAPLAEAMHQALGVPVVEPAAAAIKLAETLVALNAHLGRR